MANTISGKVIAISQIQSVPSKDASKQPTQMRQLLLDCTRFDPYTGERSEYENTPIFDFRGENMRLLEGIQPNDVVTISFDVNGYKYKDEHGKTKVFTYIRPYQIVKREKKQQAPKQEQPASDLPFDKPQGNDDIF